MGENIRLDGRTIKIGTCESLYYVRYDQLTKWVETGRATRAPGNLDPAEYLLPKYGFRFRFPFQDEDGEDLTITEHYNRGYTISAPADFMQGIEHLDICHSVGPIGEKWGGYVSNIWHPCPLSLTKTDTRRPDHAVIQIVQQKPVGDQLWTVARCAYCGSAFRINADEASALVEHERRIYGKIRHGELFRRMMAGYGQTLSI